MWKIILTLHVFYVVRAYEECDKLGILLYEDLGCTPVYTKDVKCPTEYDCQNISAANNTCMFRGRSIAAGEQIDNDESYKTCSVGCFCNELGKFTCAVLDCAEWLGSPIGKGCYRTYEVDKCCSVGQNCPSEDSKFGQCEVDGKKYQEGQVFYAKNTCAKCVCPKDYNGKLEEPHCRRQRCNVQIHRLYQVQQKCAPFYRKSEKESALCCPSEWICPSPDDKIEFPASAVEKNTDTPCHFGSKSLQIGEHLQSEVDFYGTKIKAKCECILPPFLTCKEL